MQQKISELALSNPEDAQFKRRDFGISVQGFAGSVFLHGLGLVLILALIQHGRHEAPSNFRFVPVEIVNFGNDTGSQSAAAALQKAPQLPAARITRPAAHTAGPRGTKLPTDELNAKLQALSKLRSPASSVQHELDSTGSSAGRGEGLDGHYSLQDYIRAQVERRWSLDLTKPGNRNMVVKIQIEITAAGNITKAEIVEKERAALDRNYRDLAISARNAVLLSSPIILPTGQYKPIFQLTLELNPNETLR